MYIYRRVYKTLYTLSLRSTYETVHICEKNKNRNCEFLITREKYYSLCREKLFLDIFILYFFYTWCGWALAYLFISCGRSEKSLAFLKIKFLWDKRFSRNISLWFLIYKRENEEMVFALLDFFCWNIMKILEDFIKLLSNLCR